MPETASQNGSAPTGRKSQLVYRRLLNDLKSGQYIAGDQFHTINDICEQHAISTWTAIKCLNQLVEEGLLTRRQGSGTYVKTIPAKDGTDSTPDVQITVKKGLVETLKPSSSRCIDFMMPEDIGQRAGPEYFAELPRHMRKQSGEEWMLRLSLLPADIRDEEKVEQWLESRIAHGASVLVFRWMPRIAQEIAIRRGWPTCTHGHPDFGIDLPFVDHDQQQAGQIASEFFVRHNCQRVAVIMRSEWRPGDNLMVNTLMQRMAGRIATVISCPPTDTDVDGAVRRILDESQAIDGILIRNHPGQWLPANVDALLQRSTPVRVVSSGLKFNPRVATVVPTDEMVYKALGDMASMLSAGTELVNRSIELPVSLPEPQ